MKRPEDAIHAPTERPLQREPVRRRAVGGSALGLSLPMGLLAASVLLVACNLDNPGVTAPVGTLSYPIAVALAPADGDAGSPFLYVANSNFDLAFSTGNVQSYDLEALEKRLEEQNCRKLEADGVMLDGGVRIVPNETVGAGTTTGDAGVLPDGGIALPADYTATSDYGNARGVLCDGRDPVAGGRDGRGWLVPDDGVEPIPPGATGLRPPIRCCFDEGNRLGAIRKSEQQIDSFASGIGVAPDGKRVYVPISSRAALLYLTVEDDGTLKCGDEKGRCRRGADPDSANAEGTDPDLKFPGQPASMLVGTLDQLGAKENTTFIATAHELGGFGMFVDRGADGPVLQAAINGLPLRPTSVVLSPAERLLYVANAGENINYLTRVGVKTDTDNPLLYTSSQVTLTGFAQPRDMRDVAFDRRDPKRLYALVRGLQESVAFLELDPSTVPNARLVASVRVGSGPSKLEYIEIDGRAFLLVSCYDARAVFVIDADLREVVGVVRNLAGPYTMTFDAARKLLYVADFRASVVRVVDLRGVTDKREPPPRIIATLGLPRFQGGLR